MKTSLRFAALLLLLYSSQAKAATLLSQNFDTDPVNYAATFGFGTANDRYFQLSNAPGIILNPTITGAAGTYLAAQNLNEAPFPPYSEAAPAVLTFNPVPLAGATGLQVTGSFAGLPGAETVNFIRGAIDSNDDGTYETQVFKFAGTADNTAYTDTTTGTARALSAAFQPFTFDIPQPTAGVLKFQIQAFNDTDGFGEAVGIDTILLTSGAVPPPIGNPVQVPVGGITETFAALPAKAAFSGATLPVDGATITDIATMTTAVGGLVVNTSGLASVTTVGSSSTGAQYQSANQNVQTGPTVIAANVLTSHLQNATGSAVSKVHVTYDLGSLNPTVASTENPTGHGIYYSLTGAAGSWTLADQFGFDGGPTTLVPQNHAFDITLGNWGVGADLYVAWVDDNANVGTDQLYTIDNINFLPTISGGGGTDPIKVVVTPATGSTVNSGGTVQATNQVVGINPTQDSATVSGVATTGAGFTQTGLSNGTIAAGASQTGTVAFAKTATMLNGPAYGKLDFAVASGPNGAGTGAGSYSYILKGTVTGNTGNGSSVVPVGQVYTGLSSTSGIAPVGANLPSVATILGGSNTSAADKTVATVWRARTAAELPPGSAILPSFANSLTSDVVNMTGPEGTLFAMQMNYNPGDLQQPDVANQLIGHLFLASQNPANNVWENAVARNTGANTTNPAFTNVNGSYASFLALNGGTLTPAMLGAWGVDTAADTVWAVLNHSGNFASVPEPSSILLGSFGLVGLVIGAYRRRRQMA